MIKEYKAVTIIMWQQTTFMFTSCSFNQVFLFHIPSWDTSQDEVICYSELKLGIVAQSCLAPGFSTLVTNLFSTLSHEVWL